MYGSGINFYPAFKSTSLLKNLIGLKNKINFGAILTNTQKTLNVVNQAIPLVYQVKPIISNAKTVLKVMHAVKDNSSCPVNKINNNIKKEKDINISNSFKNEPKFFI